jgi:outer membrane lipoprotein LolB
LSARRGGGLLLLLALLAGCAPPPTRPDRDTLIERQAARESRLTQRSEWSLVGRIAVDQGGNGGSGRIEWQQHGDDFDIRLSAPISRQSWRLSRIGGQVRLDGLAGGPRSGDDAEALLLDATGWRIPVAALSAWVRGARAGADAQIEFGDDGLPTTLHQSGWTVNYRAWNRDDPPLPTKVFAEQGAARVRLAVEQWRSP